MKIRQLIVGSLLLLPTLLTAQQNDVSPELMQGVYEEVRTPYKYGLILLPEEGQMVDSPSIFRSGKRWYMTYIIYDGQGYETWLAHSNDLIHWTNEGKILSFTEGTWDANQKAGYIALQDYTWGGGYELQKYREHYWLSYLGGDTRGYEAGTLGVGIAWSKKATVAREWERLDHAVLSPDDSTANWFDDHVIYKSSIIWDHHHTTGHPFVMFYNAKSRIRSNNKGVERIGMAVSDDMIHWERFGTEPVVDHHAGITGDAQITRIGDLWVMFYFGASWKPGAFDRFACSYDLVHWTLWEGEDLIAPSEDFDAQYAHKPFVLKVDGVVYHYYNAVDRENNRGIALATSVPIGKSELSFKK